MQSCTECDEEILDARAIYCGACGTRIGLRVTSAENSSFDDNAPLHPPSGWVTEIKYATVMFVDMVQSTELVSMLDAEGAMQRLQPILDIMCQVILDFDGVVLSTLGDGIVALFGAVRTEERHAERGCQAALSLRNVIRALSSAPMLRVGLHSGEIVVRYPLSKPDGALKAYGVAIHLASRLPSKVGPNEICLSEACFGLVRQGCLATTLGSHRLRGVPQTVRLYLLESLVTVDPERIFEQTSSTFLGREREMALLVSSLDAALMGASRPVCLVGTPGSGKSRLCHEFAKTCDARQVPVFRAGIFPYGATSPTRSLGVLLKEAFLDPYCAGSQALARSIGSLLALIGATSATDLSLICGLFGMPAGEKPQVMPPKARLDRLIDIVGRLVRLLDGPKVLILEDVHWIDEHARELLTGLINATAGTHTLLILNSRSAEAAFEMKQAIRNVELTDLSASDTLLLVDGLVGSAADLAPMRVKLVERSAGNPFFAEELVRSLAEEGVIIGQPGAYRAGVMLDSLPLPLTVQAVIGSRIDRLPQAVREVLHVIAVIGIQFDTAVLEVIFSAQAEGLYDKLGRLRSAGLIRWREGLTGVQCEFRHPLVQEVSYKVQLRAHRAVRHSEVAQAMRKLFPECDGETAGVIAGHLEKAGQFEDAAFFGAQAARWSAQHNSRAAIDRWLKVRVLLQSAPFSPETEALAIEANGQVAWLGWREGYTASQAEPYLHDALTSAVRSGHPMTTLLMLARGRIAQVSGGDADVFVRSLQEAVALSKAQGDHGRVATLQASLSHALGWAGLLNQALAANDAAIATAHLVTDADQQFLGYDVRNWALSLRGRILLRLGMISSARELFDLMIAREGSLDPTVTFVGHFGYVELAQHTGDSALAADHANRLDALAKRHGSAYLQFYASVANAYAEGVAGYTDRAIQGVRSCLALQKKSGAAKEFEPELLVSLAGFELRLGRSLDAQLTAKNAWEMARCRGARLPLMRAILLQAEADFAMRGAGEGLEDCRDAIVRATLLLEETGARLYLPLFARVQRLLD